MSFWGTRPSPFTTSEVTVLQGIADHSYTNGQLIIGNTSTGGVNFATLTAGLNVTITNAGGSITIAATGGSSNTLVVGSSSVTSGTSTRVLFDNAGTLGEYAISGTGSVVMTSSPTITTPTISGHFTAEGVTTTGASGTGNLVFSTSPSISGATITTSTVNGVTLTTGGGTSTFLNANGAYSSPSGSGTVNSGTSGQIAYYASSTTAVSGNANATIAAGALTLGVAASVIGQVLFANTTSGVTTLTPGATSAGTLTLPAGTDTLIGKATTDTLTNKTYDTAGSGNAFKINGTAISAVTGTGAVVLATSPTVTLASASTAVTQSAGDNTTAIATDAFVTTAVANAIAAVNPAMAVQCATTAAGDTSGLTYVHVAGVGDTFTGTANTAITIDGHALLAGDRVLIKNDTQTSPGSVSAGTFNGIYLVTTIQSLGVPPVLTRALDYDTPSDINNTGAIPVVLGTTNANTSWLLTSSIAAVGTGSNALTYVQFSVAPSTIVIGPASATTGVPALFNGTTGKLLQNSTPTGTGNPVMQTSPSLTTPTLGVATATTINKVTLTAPATGSTFTISDGKTLTVNQTMTLTSSGTSSIITFPNSTDTVGGLGTAQTWTAQNKFNNIIDVNNAVSVTTNAGTVPVTSRLNTFSNSSAATMTITMATSSAVDGQMTIVRILDFSGVAETITWVNTENSTVSVPTTSNGSTTLFLTVGFIYNAGTSKWRCIASA